MLILWYKRHIYGKQEKDARVTRVHGYGCALGIQRWLHSIRQNRIESLHCRNNPNVVTLVATIIVSMKHATGA